MGVQASVTKPNGLAMTMAQERHILMPSVFVYAVPMPQITLHSSKFISNVAGHICQASFYSKWK